ncbi:MAG TPA: hypothetical protein VLX61_00895 [Anaerolineales bacterium]|nr:hypothetical protein [Anaerolineales bacterium]
MSQDPLLNEDEQRKETGHFRDLPRGPETLLLPGAWDAAAARMFERAGFVPPEADIHRASLALKRALAPAWRKIGLQPS